MHKTCCGLLLANFLWSYEQVKRNWVSEFVRKTKACPIQNWTCPCLPHFLKPCPALHPLPSSFRLPWDSVACHGSPIFGISHGLPWSPNFEYLATWTHLKFHKVPTWIWEWTLGSSLCKETASPISKRKTPGQCLFGEVSEKCHQIPRAGWEYHKWCRHKRHVQTECQNSVRKTKGPRQSVKIVSAHSGHKTRVSEKYQKSSKTMSNVLNYPYEDAHHIEAVSCSIRKQLSMHGRKPSYCKKTMEISF